MHITTYIPEIDQYIDTKILPLILEIWNRGGSTFQCCIGSIIEPEEDDSISRVNPRERIETY